MTREEAENVLQYVAQNIISPLAFDPTPAMDVWLRLIKDDFNHFCKFVCDMIDDKQGS